MPVKANQNKNDIIAYPCPLCSYKDFCKYVDTVAKTVAQTMDHGKFQYICDLFAKKDTASGQKEEIPQPKEEKESNDTQLKNLIEETGIHGEDCKRIETCPVCGKKNVLAIRCRECGEFVCTTCGELDEVFDNIIDDDTNTGSMKSTVEFTCHKCAPLDREITQEEEDDDDIVITTLADEQPQSIDL